MFKLFFIDEKSSNFKSFSSLLEPLGEVHYFTSTEAFLQSQIKDQFIFGVIGCDFGKYSCESCVSGLLEAGVSSFSLLGADDNQHSKEVSLALGAVDYFWRNMPIREMQLRIENAFNLVKQNTPKLYCANLRLNRFLQCAHIDDQNLDLTQREFHILNSLVRCYPGSLEKELILHGLWEDVSVSPQTLNTHILNLRKKLAEWSYCIEFKRSSGFGLAPKQELSKDI